MLIGGKVIVSMLCVLDIYWPTSCASNIARFHSSKHAYLHNYKHLPEGSETLHQFPNIPHIESSCDSRRWLSVAPDVQVQR